MNQTTRRYAPRSAARAAMTRTPMHIARTPYSVTRVMYALEPVLADGRAGCLEGVIAHHCRVDVEVAVAAQAPRLVRGHVGAHLVRGVAVDRGGAHPRRLVGDVVRHLVLEEDRLAVLAVPDDLELLVV